MPISENLPSLPNLLVTHERWNIDRLDELLSSFSKGELVVGDKIIYIKRFDGQNWQLPSSFRPRVVECNYPQWNLSFDYTSFLLEVWETIYNTPQDELNLIDRQLRSKHPPWNGLVDLRQNFIGYGKEMASRTDAGTARIIAPLGARLSNKTILEEKSIKAFVEIKDRVISEEIGLSVIANLFDGTIVRMHKPLKELCKNKDNYTFVGTVPLPSSPSKIILTLTYRGVETDHLEFFGKATQNMRLAILQQLCGDPQIFLKEIRDHRFESRVDILLNLLGFSPAHYGATSLEAPDILAFPNEGNWLLVVECTEREPDVSNKLTKLATRTKVIMKASDGLIAYPVIVTAFERSMLNKTDEEKAAKERITIVTADEISYLYQMALEEVGPEKIRDYLLQLIPYISTI